jgi:hypothetical protein
LYLSGIIDRRIAVDDMNRKRFGTESNWVTLIGGREGKVLSAELAGGERMWN